jgi:hypothetical protein
MLIAYRKTRADEVQFETAVGLAVVPIAMSVLQSGYELIHIGRNKDDECEISIADVHSAKRNRDRFLQEGAPCAPLPELHD